MNCSFKHILIFLWCFAAWGKVAASNVAGHMTNDSQKGAIAYNHLGLTTSVVQGSDTLSYTYDGTGRRVKKRFGSLTRYYADGVEYSGDTLKFIATPEGRIRKVGAEWQRDYFLKDHLGNVRVVLDAGTSTSDVTFFSSGGSVTYLATMEESKAEHEEQFFANMSLTRADAPYNYPDKNPLNAKLSKVPGKSKGLRITLRVMAGDTISISAKAFYNMDKTLPGKGVDIVPVLGSAITAMSSPESMILSEATRLAVDLGAEASQSVTLINVPQTVDNNEEAKPKSGINFILYDNVFDIVEANTGVLLVEERINEIQTLATDNLVMQEAGFIEIFVNNEAQTPVYYDNFMVTMSSGNSAVSEVNAYFPFGMIMPGLSLQALPEKWNGYKFSAKEIQEMTGWYDFHARPYDPVIGRTPTPDPHAESYYSMSPYSMFGNNPVNNIDPTGMDYWSTNDPEEIKRLLSMLQFGNNSSESFNYESWIHATDEEFLGKQRKDGSYDKLTYNDQTRTFYTSYNTIENGEVVVHGVSFKAANRLVSTDGFETVENRFYHRPTGGGLENTYPEAALLTGGTRAGIGLLKFFWRSMTNTVSTTNTIDANSGFAAGKEFRGGKQNARDASIKQYPSEFQRWYHKFYKGSSRGDASRQELQELYQEWINMGKPKVK